MVAVTIDDLISSDEEAAPVAPVAPTGRLAPPSLAAAQRSRKPQKPAAPAHVKVIDYLSSSDETDQSPAPAADTAHAALCQAARVAQQRSRYVEASSPYASSPSHRQFTSQSPTPSLALYLPTLSGESSLLQEAGATGQAAVDEAALYDAAGGAALSELMTSLLHAALSSGDVATEAALQAAVQSLSTCQQQQSLRLQRAVASLRSDLRDRLLRLEREFVAKAELLAGDLSEAVRAEKAASEDTVARCAAELSASLQDLGDARRRRAQPPPSARHQPQSNGPGPKRELVTPRPTAEWCMVESERESRRAAPPNTSDSPWRQGTRARLSDELDSDSD